ncbi:MAG: methyltransferase [Planctomycetota bacterium]
MAGRNPRAFPLDDRRVYDAYISGRTSAALAVGVRCGLFDLLERGALNEPGIAAALGFAPRGTRSLLIALQAIGLVEMSANGYALSADASAYLVRGKPGYLGALIDLEMEHFLSPALLLQALAKGTASVYGDADPWAQHGLAPEQARKFTDAMHSVSARPAAGLAEVVDLAHTRRLLDVGGGSGALSIAIARAWRAITCTVWDLPVVCAIAREYAAAAGVGDRVLATAGDMFRQAFPTGYAVLLSQILHDWPPEKGRELAREGGARAARARPGDHPREAGRRRPPGAARERAREPRHAGVDRGPAVQRGGAARAAHRRGVHRDRAQEHRWLLERAGRAQGRLTPARASPGLCRARRDFLARMHLPMPITLY